MYLSGSSASASKVYNVLSLVFEIITLRRLWSPLPRGRQSRVALIIDTVPPMLRNIIIYPSVFFPRKLCRSNSVRTESNGNRSHKAMSRWRQFLQRSGGLTQRSTQYLSLLRTCREFQRMLGMTGIEASNSLPTPYITFQITLAYTNQPKALFES